MSVEHYYKTYKEDTVDGNPFIVYSNNKNVLPVANGGTGLDASPSMLVNLASSEAADILGESPRPGVTGVLPVANGGTGLDASPSMLVNLASSEAADILGESPRPGVTGVLPVANGGTGANNATDACDNLKCVRLNENSEIISIRYYVSQSNEKRLYVYDSNGVTLGYVTLSS